MPISLVCFVCLFVCFLQKESHMIITLLPQFSWSVFQTKNLHLHIRFLPSFMVLAQRKCGPPNSNNMSYVFPFEIGFHRKVSAKAWNGISFFKRNVLTNEISFWNILAAIPVLLNLVKGPNKTFHLLFNRIFREAKPWRTTTPLTAILEKDTIEGHVHP